MLEVGFGRGEADEEEKRRRKKKGKKNVSLENILGSGDAALSISMILVTARCVFDGIHPKQSLARTLKSSTAPWSTHSFWSLCHFFLYVSNCAGWVWTS
jgi:hypothetical protein